MNPNELNDEAQFLKREIRRFETRLAEVEAAVYLNDGDPLAALPQGGAAKERRGGVRTLLVVVLAIGAVTLAVAQALGQLN